MGAITMRLRRLIPLEKANASNSFWLVGFNGVVLSKRLSGHGNGGEHSFRIVETKIALAGAID
jgi:hypothetical protein